jgi:glycogenin glucosyltransferase
VVEVEPIENPSPPESHHYEPFATLFTKLRIWERVEYDRIIYLDSDTVALGSLDELLSRPRFAAAPCISMPDFFNAGVLVIEPSTETFDDMISKIGPLLAYDGSDQGFLNLYYSDWYTGPPEHRLPIRYNVPRYLYYFKGSWNHLRSDMRVLHFIGPHKPWAGINRFRRRLLHRLISRHPFFDQRGPTPVELWWNFYNELNR